MLTKLLISTLLRRTVCISEQTNCIVIFCLFLFLIFSTIFDSVILSNYFRTLTLQTWAMANLSHLRFIYLYIFSQVFLKYNAFMKLTHFSVSGRLKIL